MGLYKRNMKHRYETSLYELLDALGSVAGTRDSEIVTSLFIHLLASGRGRVQRLGAAGGSHRIAGLRRAKTDLCKDGAVLDNIDFVSGL